MPPCKGSLFHGALGCALAEIGMTFRDYFYNPPPLPHWQDKRQAPPRPYMLMPPLEIDTHYAAGDTLNVGIILYGAAVDHFSVIFAAFEHLGERMGLGHKSSRFQIDCVRQLTINGDVMLYQNPHWLSSVQTLNSRRLFSQPTASVPRIRLRHLTRLRIKAGNQLLRSPPPFGLLLNRLLGRINALASQYGDGLLLPPAEKRELLEAAASVRTEHSTLQWADWPRYSQRSGDTMPFGGLLGETVYYGELTPFVPWLTMGQWTGIGGKTSFGLGLFKVETIS